MTQEIVPQPQWPYPPSLFTARLEPGSGVTGLPFCRVVGIIEKEINFELWLPSNWSGRFEGVGNGGLTGAINYPAMGTALALGNAVASTDTGHKTETGFFQSDWIIGHPQRVVDFGHRAHHLMALTAKKIVAAYYGRAAHHAYYLGCSSGGWQGLSEAQKYPSDYDGIIAGAPAINFVKLQSRIVILKQLALRNPAGNLLPAKAALLQSAAIKRCDAADGVVDGIISDLNACRFDPGELLCTEGDNADCLTAAQVKRARLLYGPMRSAGGLPLYPGPAYGTYPFARLPGQTPELTGLPAVTLMLRSPPAWNVATFDADRDIPPMERELEDSMDAMNAKLRPFAARGGKLILYHGLADDLLSPYNTIDYFERVRTVLGASATAAFARLYLVPGMGHCGGGPGPNRFDALTALVAWVEHDTAPKELIASHLREGAAERTRPLCPYPQVATYTGSGDSDQAKNFVCRGR
jgi:feruloyl esterase